MWVISLVLKEVVQDTLVLQSTILATMVFTIMVAAIDLTGKINLQSLLLKYEINKNCLGHWYSARESI